MQCYLKDYPRPQLVRKSWQSLTGQWDFRFDDAGQGEREGWQHGFEAEHAIRVPFSYESPASGIGDETPHSAVWYARTFTLPGQDRGEGLHLHFEGSDFHTKVWVNGLYAGEHTGGYARFSLDIAAQAKVGENLLVVRVRDPLEEGQPRGKQRWTPQSHGCWYVQSTGLWKSVWLEPLPGAYIARLKLTPKPAAHTLVIEAEIAGEAEEICLWASASYQGLPAGSLESPVKGRQVRLELDVYSTAIDPWGVKRWEPGSPALYDLRLELRREGRTVDAAGSYFGMREVSIKGRQVLLNGAPLYQRLVLDQGYWPDSHLTPPHEEAILADIDSILRLGYNGVRKHQKVEDERFLYWCDVKGLLVWSEMAAAYAFHDEAAERFTREWMEVVRQNYNHPCIITWVPFNESWGIPQVRTEGAQQAFTQAIYYLTKAFDPMRPVIVNDGWEHTISDIITLHDYQASGEAFRGKYASRLEEILSGSIPHSDFRFAFADGFEYRGQPIILSEYGGIAYTTRDGWGYGGQVASQEAFLARFRSITEAIQSIPEICGFCYTQLTHVQQEQNGLMDENRHMLVDADAVAAINRQRGAY